MNNDILLKTANKYLLNDIEGACNQGGRFANILSKLEIDGQLSSVLLEFLKHRGFHALHRFAAGKISFEDYLPLAQEEQNTRCEEQNTRRRVADRMAEEAERERQNLARQMSERNEAMQRAWSERIEATGVGSGATNTQRATTCTDVGPAISGQNARQHTTTDIWSGCIYRAGELSKTDGVVAQSR